MSELISRIERELARPDPAEQDQQPPRWPRYVLATGAVLLTPFLLAEILLRVIWTPPPRVGATAREATASAAAASLNQRFGVDAFETDPHLLWRLRPGSNLEGIPVSAQSLLGAASPPFPVHRPGLIRILVLGDSVPALTYRAFPSIIQRLARSTPEAPEITVVNAATPGYSTEQGLLRLEQLGGLRPDVVIACFGLADRSPALNLPDRYLLAGTGTASGLARRVLGNFRVVQWLTGPAPDRWTNSRSLDLSSRRVSPERFEQNLVALAELARRFGALPILATEPGHASAPDGGEEKNAAATTASLSAGERQGSALFYNEIVRRACERSGAALLDLDEEFIRRDRERLLEADGIHLTSPGHNLTARLVFSILRDRGILDPRVVNAVASAARYDTSAPDRLSAEWTLLPSRLDTSTTATSVPVGILVRNAGNTRWLRDHIVQEYGTRRDFDYGGLAVVARWRTAGAGETTAPAARVPLPQDVLPGESTSITLTLDPPRNPGTYAAEIGLTTEGYGDLSRLGAETTTLTVTARRP